MLFRIVLALGLQIFLSVALQAQVVCQVIENIGCPTITELLCPNSISCQLQVGHVDPQCTVEGVRKVAGATRHGVRPANANEAGFYAANHVGNNYCKQTRVCDNDCLLTGQPPVQLWKCQWKAGTEWVDSGDNYVLLQGAYGCMGDPQGPID